MVVAPPLITRPPVAVPLPIVEEADDWKPFNMPREVRDEFTTPAASVAPEREPAGADPEKLPAMVPAVRVPIVALFAKRFVVDALPEAKKFVVVALSLIHI